MNQAQGGRRARACGASIICLVLMGCGRVVSTEDRRDPDGEVDLGLVGVAPEAPAADAVCRRTDADPYGYTYATDFDFWLGSQESWPLVVDGMGFLATRADEQSEPLFAKDVEFSVAPDGTLEDASGAALLGYLPRENAGGPCVGPLRAPLFSPPAATSRVSFSMNLDPRLPRLAFDVTQPDQTANFSVSMSVFDSRGGSHYLDVYFGAADFGEYGYFYQSGFAYYALVDGSDLVGGTPGVDQIVGSGTLAFNSDGALDTATIPQLSVSFSGGATANQGIYLDFGPDITNDGSTGLQQVTSFASESAVYGLYVDGYTAGTGSDVRVDAGGEVTVGFDSGAELYIGKLALARFAREAALAPDESGKLRATARSGPPQYGNPRGPGRGSL